MADTKNETQIMWIASKYSPSWMELKCRLSGIRFTAYCSIRKPIILVIKRSSLITPEMRICYKMFGKILYGQVSICGEAESPYWVMDHCEPSEQAIEYIRICTVTDKKFHDFLYEYCRKKVNELKMDRVTAEYVYMHASTKNPLRNDRKFKIWQKIDADRDRLKRFFFKGDS